MTIKNTSHPKSSITFIGLGVMGAPMAGHLQKAEIPITVFNRSPQKSVAWVERYSGKMATDIPSAVMEVDMVFMCLGDDHSVEETLLGHYGVFDNCRPGAIIIDHTTTSSTLAVRMAAAASKADVHYLDAPVSGGEAGAQNGALTIMVGGHKASFEKVEPVLKCYAKAVTLMGKSGSGQLTKMVNQLCIAGLVQSLAEGLAFSEKAGLNSKQVLSVISQGAAQSWQMENRGQTMIDDQFDFGFAVDHMRKDLGLCLAQANAIDAQTPIATLVDQYYAEIQSKGGARWDTSSLIRRIR